MFAFVAVTFTVRHCQEEGVMAECRRRVRLAVRADQLSPPQQPRRRGARVAAAPGRGAGHRAQRRRRSQRGRRAAGGGRARNVRMLPPLFGLRARILAGATIEAGVGFRRRWVCIDT